MKYFFQVIASILLISWLTSAKAVDSTNLIPATNAAPGAPGNAFILAGGVIHEMHAKPSTITTGITTPCPPNTSPQLFTAIKNTSSTTNQGSGDANLDYLAMNVSLNMDYTINSASEFGLIMYSQNGGKNFYNLTMSWFVYCIPSPGCTPPTSLPQTYPSCGGKPKPTFPAACWCT